MKRNQLITFALAAVLLVIVSAGAAALMTKSVYSEKAPEKTAAVTKAHSHKEAIHWNSSQQPSQPAQQVASTCNDGNVVGYVLGGVGGGVAGNQLGKGKGNTATTIGGALGGAYLGGKYIPTQNVTCAK